MLTKGKMKSLGKIQPSYGEVDLYRYIRYAKDREFFENLMRTKVYKSIYYDNTYYEPKICLKEEFFKYKKDKETEEEVCINPHITPRVYALVEEKEINILEYDNENDDYIITRPYESILVEIKEAYEEMKKREEREVKIFLEEKEKIKNLFDSFDFTLEDKTEE